MRFPALGQASPALTEAEVQSRGHQRRDRPAREEDRQRRALGLSRRCGKLRELRPDVIVTQSQCEVCAVSERDVEAAVASGSARSRGSFRWRRTASTMSSPTCSGSPTRSTRMRAAWNWSSGCVRGSAKSRTNARRARDAAARRDDRVDRSADGGGQLDAGAGRDGGRNQSVRHGRRAFAVDEIRGARRAGSRCDSDFAVRLRHGSRGAGSARADESRGMARDSRRCATGASSWPTATSISTGPGPRIVESLEILAEIAHPELFHFGHEGTGWRRL